MKVETRTKKKIYKKIFEFHNNLEKRIECLLKMKNPAINKTEKVNGDKDYRKIK